jgi:hypothetical protein
MNVNTSSVQELVRGGEKHDIYYYNSASLFIQSRPTLTNTKFLQQLVSFNSGTSQMIFSPDQGLSDVFLTFKLKAQGTDGINYTNFGLGRGWGYSLIDTIAVRYGGSSQYFWTGQQMMMQNIVDMQDAVSRDTLFSLGGQGCIGADGDFVENQYAYCYINLPHNTPNGDGLKMNPLPTELLRQPVLIQVSLKNAQSVFSCVGVPGGLLAVAPVEEAYFQVRQIRMVNSDDLLTSKADPMSLTYTYPLKYFAQQQYSVNMPANSATNPTTVNLTGFRNGQVRSILMWLSNKVDTPSSADISGNKIYEPFAWYAPENVELSINGEIFYKAKYGSSLLIDLVNNKQPTQLAIAPVTISAGALVPVSGGFTSSYCKVDFAQHNDPITENSLLVGGKTITNSIVNVTLSAPDDSANWVLNAVYMYNSSLVFASGNAEYTF